MLQKKLVSIHLFEPESKFYRSISWLVGFWDSALSLNEPRRSRPPLCPPEPRDILRQCCFSAASCHPTLNYIVSPVTMNRMREAVYERLNKWFRTMWKQPNPWDEAYGALQVKRHLGWKTETFVVEGKKLKVCRHLPVAWLHIIISKGVCFLWRVRLIKTPLKLLCSAAFLKGQFTTKSSPVSLPGLFCCELSDVSAFLLMRLSIRRFSFLCLHLPTNPSVQLADSTGQPR